MVNQIRELRSGSIKFKNSFKKLAVTFKTYIDFESVLKEVRGSDRKNNTSYTRKYETYIPWSFAYKVACIDEKVSKSVVLYRGKIQSITLLKQFLKSMIIAKKQ